MPTITSNTSVVFDGASPVQFDGETHYQWFNSFLEIASFWSPDPLPMLTVTLTGSDWGMGVFRHAGLGRLTINDGAGENRRIDAITDYSDGLTRITLNTTSTEFLRTGDGNDVIKIGNVGIASMLTSGGNDVVIIDSDIGAGHIDLGHGNNRLTLQGDGFVQSITSGVDNDKFVLLSEFETLSTGRGNDRVTLGDAWGGTIYTGRGSDQVKMGAASVDFIALGRDADRLIAAVQAEPDFRVVVSGGGGVSSPEDADIDVMDFRFFTADITMNLQHGIVDSAQGRFRLHEIENIVSGSGNDTLRGNWEDNRIEGRDGNDVIHFGEGADVLFGQGGADHFVLDFVDEGIDRIIDFRRGQGDKIDVSQLDADTTLAGQQDFTFIGTAGFSGNAGELRALNFGGSARVMADIDGDGGVDLTFIAVDAGLLGSGDFIF